jgi:hypothetical protein
MNNLMQALPGRNVDGRLRLSAQNDAPEIKFDSVPTLCNFPPESISAKWAAWLPIRAAIFSSTRAPAIPPSRSAPRVLSRTAVRGCSSSTAPASSCARSARTHTASCSPPRSGSIRATTSGWWIR